MKLPNRINKVLKEKLEYIDSRRSKLEKTVVKNQSKFLDEVIADLMAKLKFDEAGNLRDITSNYRVLADFDRLAKSFNKLSSLAIADEIIKTIGGLINLGRNYFAVLLQGNLPERFENIIASTSVKMNLRIGLSTSVKMNLRIGLDGGEMIRGGFLESFLNDPTTASQVKNYISKAITGQVDTKNFISGLTKIVNGDEGPGAMEKQYQRFAYDLYNQYDAAYNLSLSDEFGMNYFVYQGGLIGDSRDFCAAHNNKVWHRSEAEDWYDWTPAQGEYPPGYEVKSKNIYEVPSYLGYPGYQPLIDRGGYNCRHILAWISDDLAFELRPELKSE